MAAREAVDLLSNFTPHIENLTLIPSKGGVFEVIFGDELLFSKKELGRFPHEDELINIVKEKLS